MPTPPTSPTDEELARLLAAGIMRPDPGAPGDGGGPVADADAAALDLRALVEDGEDADAELRALLERRLPTRTARWVREVVRAHMLPEVVVRLHRIAMGRSRHAVPTMSGKVVYVPASAAVQVRAGEALLRVGVPAQLGIADEGARPVPSAIALPALVGLDGREAVPIARGTDGVLVYDGGASLRTPEAERVDLAELAERAEAPPPAAGAPDGPPLEYVEVDEGGPELLDVAPDAHRVAAPEEAAPIAPAAVEVVRRRLAARRPRIVDGATH